MQLASSLQSNDSSKHRTVASLVMALCLLTTVTACQSSRDAVEAQSRDSSGSSASDRGGKGLKVVALPDPSFGGMPATFIAVPGGWHAQGQIITNQCAGTMPFAAWNANSPDDREEFNVLPLYGWRWGNGAQFGQGCAPFHGTPHAADFLKLFASKLPGQVRVVGEMSVTDAFRSREEKFTNNSNSQNARLYPALRSHNFGDVAAVRAVDGSGNELRLRTWVQCRQRSQGGDCFARVDILRAPKGQLNALVAEVDSRNLVQDVPDEQWKQAFMRHQQQVGNSEMNTLRQNAKADSAALRNQYLESTARLREEHQAGMEELQRQGQDANRNAMNDMNARTTAASDWRDYAADQQTVSGVNGTYKTSSQYSNVWSSPYGPPLSDGRTFGSTDNTLDPNTATDNTWTQDHKVHGNGQPY